MRRKSFTYDAEDVAGELTMSGKSAVQLVATAQQLPSEDMRGKQKR